MRQFTAHTPRRSGNECGSAPVDSGTPRVISALEGIAVVVAWVVGIPLWLTVLMLVHGSPFGSPGSLDMLVIFAPAVGFSMPVAFANFFARPVLSSWILAITPLILVANVLVTVSVANRFQDHEYAALAFSLVWLIPLGMMVFFQIRQRLQNDK